MSINTPGVRRLGRAGNPSNSERRVRADFAHAAVFAEFGRNGWALDHADFVDRKP